MELLQENSQATKSGTDTEGSKVPDWIKITEEMYKIVRPSDLANLVKESKMSKDPWDDDEYTPPSQVKPISTPTTDLNKKWHSLAVNRIYSHPKRMLVEMYYMSEMSIIDIATTLGVEISELRGKMADYNLPLKDMDRLAID